MSNNIRRAWWATVVLFLVHGLIVATWVSRIPAVQSALRLNNGILGLTLLSSAVGGGFHDSVCWLSNHQVWEQEDLRALKRSVLLECNAAGRGL